MEAKTDKKVQRITAVLAILVIVGGLGIMSMPVLAQAATPCITFQSDPPVSYGGCTSTGSGSSSILSMSSPVSI